jgi:hypothetical protein
LPTQQEALAMGKARFAQLCEMRAQRLIDEQTDPLNKGYRPPIWHVADELLVDGKEVILVDPSWDIEDPALRRRRPPDFLAEADRRKREGLGPIIIIGRRELWIAGSNRSSKTEYAAFKLNETGARIPHGRTWSWSDSEEKSRAKQHPIVFKYLPREWKDLLNSKGKAKSTEIKIGYGPDGFIGNKFSVPNGWKHWFNNYKQDLRDVEGDQINMSWHDEERDPERLKTVRVPVRRSPRDSAGSHSPASTPRLWRSLPNTKPECGSCSRSTPNGSRSNAPALRRRSRRSRG